MSEPQRLGKLAGYQDCDGEFDATGRVSSLKYGAFRCLTFDLRGRFVAIRGINTSACFYPHAT